MLSLSVRKIVKAVVRHFAWPRHRRRRRQAGRFHSAAAFENEEKAETQEGDNLRLNPDELRQRPINQRGI